MAIRLDAPTGTWQRQGIVGGIFSIIWKDANNIIFRDANNIVWRDREIELLQRFISIEDGWTRQYLLFLLFCGEEVITCGNEYFTCGGGYTSTRSFKPVGVSIRQDAIT